MHIAKYKITACGHITRHFERSASNYSNKNIDPSRTHLNYNLAPERDCTQMQYIRDALEEIPHLKRKDLVVMAGLILTVPKDLDAKHHDAFFKNSYNFLVKRFCGDFENPENGVISCYVHLDEKTPHMHFAFLPIKNKTLKNGETELRFNSRDLINRQQLATLHQDLEEYLNNECCLRCKILNGATKRNPYGRALTVKELKQLSPSRAYTREYGRAIGGRW